jgi:hypothetical protein
MARCFERALLAALGRSSGPDNFEISPSMELMLSRALELDLAQADPLDSLYAALRLAAAFDGELRSPSHARLIRTLMQREPRAVRLLSAARKHGVSALDELRGFARREGRTVSLTAPRENGARPSHGISIRNLFPKGRYDGR